MVKGTIQFMVDTINKTRYNILHSKKEGGMFYRITI